MQTYRLGPGETLGGLLDRTGVRTAEASGILEALRPAANVRKLQAGLLVSLFRWSAPDSLHAVELEMDPDSTIRLEATSEGWRHHMVATPVRLDTLYADGLIRDGGSLYLSLVEQARLASGPEERIQMVYGLAEIYSYQLDFSHDIRPGDSWRAVWVREVRPDGSVRSRRLLAAEVVSQEKTYRGIRYQVSEDRLDYFDMEGKSLRLAFKRYPVDYPRITSSFSARRYHPVLKTTRAHYGTDFGASRGTPVKATADGTISKAARDGSYGNLVVIRHPSGYETRYAHLNGYARGIRAGAKVVQGQVIGYVGSTGLATASHLHYEIRRNGSALNARTVTLPGAPPIPEDRLPEFFRQAADRLDLLTRYARSVQQEGAASGQSVRAPGD